MKLYPNDIEEKLGFDRIRELLVGFCQSNKGAQRITKVKPTDRVELLHKWHDQTKEMINLRGHEKGSVSFQFPDIEEYLIKVKVPGSYLDTSQFHELKVGISTLSSWILFFEKAEKYEELRKLAQKVNIDSTLQQSIDKVIDDKGEMRDSASAELATIRSSISKTERSVRSAIQKVLKKAKSDQFTEEDSTLTVRDGRLVIPVKAEYKKRISGFVHDESATGQTVFMEPSEVLELNNQVRELKYEEQREIVRILINLSDQVRSNLTGLNHGVGLLEMLDFINAKSKLAELLEAHVPLFQKKTQIKWVNAVHPLLYLSHKESGKKIVPLTIHLDHEHRILIISGPNAGGKSVALKTVGLLQYLFQCGLPVPASEESEFGVFESLFLDIGDTQSIDNDLSTYSSHLSSMKHFLQFSNKKTLFMIDEFGTGTEPQFGGAIAESVLRELSSKKSFGVITTHYQNLKKLGEEESGMISGAMKYDPGAFEPLFELEMGKPGSSYAFEIASKIGLGKEIIEDAKKRIGKSHVDYDLMLTHLEKEKSKLEKLTGKLEQDKTDFEKVRGEYEELREMLKVERGSMIKEAKQEAKQILSDANKEVERVIREIKESKASKEKTKALRAGLDQKKSRLKVKEGNKTKPLEEGDSVKMQGQDSTGVIQKIKGKQAEVLFGSIKSIVSTDKLIFSKSSPQSQHQKKVRKLGIDLSKKMATFSHELSIRGMRAEEAIGKVESFIDEALLLGLDEVRIVHGKGYGVLREIVRSYTKDHPRIESVEDEHADRGGAGISIIRLH